MAQAPASRDIGLCLSGGGYRAMIFHAGALIRINEAGLLPRVRAVSSVSGGSIIAAWLGISWSKLQFDDHGVAKNLAEVIVDPLVEFASKGIDARAVLTGIVPGTISRRVQKLYRKRLFGDATLADLPARGEGPDFIITATNLGTGALWRFSRFGVGDFRKSPEATDTGFFQAPTIPIATAVAASSAFPPVLSPCIFDASAFAEARAAQRQVRLTDGGVFDNLGLEPLDGREFKIVLCSDGGAPFKKKAKPPKTFLRGTVHVLKVIDLQVRKLRKEELIATAQRGERKVAYWAVDGRPASYAPAVIDENDADPFEVLDVTDKAAEAMFGISTRLAAMDLAQQHRLINWGYAMCDAAVRRNVIEARCGQFPYAGGVG